MHSMLRCKFRVHPNMQYMILPSHLSYMQILGLTKMTTRSNLQHMSPQKLTFAVALLMDLSLR